jgi:hypothetical protein
MLVSSSRIEYEPLRSIGFASLSGAYAGVGMPFANPVKILKVTNLTDAALLVSFDGVTDMDVVPAMGAYVYDYSTNKTDAAGLLEQPTGKRLYVKEELTAATVGTCYVTVIYASQV